MSTTRPVIRILLLDDHESARSSLAARLNRELDLQVVLDLPCGPEALTQVGQVAPDVVLLDIRCRDGTGVSVCRTLTTSFPGTPVIVLVSYTDDQERLRTIESGARSYLLKDIKSDRLVKEIRAAASSSY